MIRFLLIILVLFTGTVAGELKIHYCRVDHRDPDFDGAVSDGRHLMVFPVIHNHDFLSKPTFGLLVKSLNIRNDRLVVASYESIFSASDSLGRNRLKRFESFLFQNRLLDMADAISVFESKNQRFLQILRIEKAATIISVDGRRLKLLDLEMEIWDTRLMAVVFRANSSVESTSKRITDEEMILQSAELLYGTLPKFYFNSIQRNW